MVTLIISRFFEYETHLMIKAVGFMAVGFMLIYAGIKFERRLARRLAEDAAATHQPPVREAGQ